MPRSLHPSSVIPCGLIVDHVEAGPGLTITARPVGASACCPKCDQPSSRVHSHYTRTLSDLPVAGRRVVITERLRDGMRNSLNAGMLPWSKLFLIAPGTESRSRPETTIPDGRTDIPIYLIEVFLRYGEHDPHAIIECKRLDGSDTYLCREYVVEGVDRFRSGKYAENHAVAFMAGYLLRGDASAAAAGVNAYLSRVARAPEHLLASDVVYQPVFWRSFHARSVPRPPIDLHHALFELSS